MYFVFFHLSLVKTIVKSAKYPVDNMPSLWKTITRFHKDEVPKIIKLAQYALTLPLHTCSCERVFSNQNLIVTGLTVQLKWKTQIPCLIKDYRNAELTSSPCVYVDGPRNNVDMTDRTRRFHESITDCNY